MQGRWEDSHLRKARGAIYGKSILALKMGFAVGAMFSKHQRHTPELRRP